jgi:3-hydroxyisobutyrate dehydrogenase-like beta-hydroxyacid dehydrogenase
MGTQIGRHLLAAGWPVVVTDVDPAATEALSSMGATRAVTAGEVAASSDLTLVIVVDDAQVREILTGSGGVFDRAAGGSIVGICSSVRPQTCRELSDEGAERGVHVLDIALARGERGAEAANLLLFCGGPLEILDACRAPLSAFAADVVHIGGVGAGQVAKTVNNVLLWACLRADVEALRLGRALGVEPAVLRSAVGLGSGSNRPLDEWGSHRLRWPEKDLEIALALAEDAGVDVPLIRALAPLMAELAVDDLHELR